MEFQHFLCELLVCDDASLTRKRERARKARLDVNFAAVNTSQQSTNDCSLVIWSTQIVIQNVRDYRRMNIAGQIFDINAVV